MPFKTSPIGAGCEWCVCSETVFEATVILTFPMNDVTDIRVARILCPVTLSSSAGLVVERAGSLAALWNSEVRLLHVRRPAEDSRESPGPGQAEGDDGERVMTRLFGLTRCLEQRVRTSAAVTEGEPAIEIQRHAELAGADIIAIGMRDQDGNPSLLMKTVAASARCPILAVQGFGEGSGRSVRQPILDILCCIDFRPASLEALGYALALARLTHGRVTALHVLAERWDGPPRRDRIIQDVRTLVEARFLELLQVAVREGSNPADRARTIVLSGLPGVEIVRVASQTASSLIVMGSDSAHDLAEDWGETAAWTMRFAPCPMLCVPRQPRGASVASPEMRLGLWGKALGRR
jgi:nucleotide-binding universal stress UspA family protein